MGMNKLLRLGWCVLLLFFVGLGTLYYDSIVPSNNREERSLLLQNITQTHSSAEKAHQTFKTIYDRQQSTQQLNTTKYPKICTIVRTYSSQNDSLPAFIFSLLATRYPNLDVLLVDTGTEQQFVGLDDIADAFNLIVGKPFIHISNYTHAHARKLSKDDMPDYGYIQTDLVLYDIMHYNPVGCEYVLVTNGDNLYAHEYFLAASPYLEQRYDMIASEFTSHHCLMYGQTHRPKQCDGQVFAELRLFWIDLGAVMINVNFLKQQNRLFVLPPDKSPNFSLAGAFSADGSFIEELAKNTNRTTVIPRVLYFHQ